MKRIAFLIAVLFQNMMLLAQGWLLQEVYDDAQDSEPIFYMQQKHKVFEKTNS